MVFKSVWVDEPREIASEQIRMQTAMARPRQEGDLIALVENHIERITLDDDALCYGGRLLLRYGRNDRQFDLYIGLPFTKGVTERSTGRTELIIGSPAHHIEAMQNQFNGALWSEDDKAFGDTIRWVNVGDTKNGFIGLDYKPQAAAHAGIARSREEVCFLARTLLGFGYDPAKRLFLLDPPYIRESVQGKMIRAQGYATLGDYAR